MIISIIAVGSELLEGETIETNSNFIKNEFNEYNIKIKWVFVVRDNKNDFFDILEFLKNKTDIIIITGGLGPTKDDITREVISEFFNIPLIFSDAIWEKIVKRMSQINLKIPENNKLQAYIPKDAIVLENNYGTAPGFIINNISPKIIALPGVPNELYKMFPKVIDFINNEIKIDNNFYNIYVKFIGLSESFLDEKIKKIIQEYDIINYGTRVNYGMVDVRFTIKAKSLNEAKNYIKDILQKDLELKNNIYSYNKEDNIQKIIIEKLKEKNKKLFIAESCTGGLISKLITDISGASNVFLGSIVSYDNLIKNKVLDVSDNILSEYGAVSFETVNQMIIGLKKIVMADYFISISGIAGPTGGTTKKPVGTVYIGIGNRTSNYLFHFLFNGDRETIRYRSAIKAFELLWYLLNGIDLEKKLIEMRNLLEYNIINL